MVFHVNNKHTVHQTPANVFWPARLAGGDSSSIAQGEGECNTYEHTNAGD